jgi:hypothetical protein
LHIFHAGWEENAASSQQCAYNPVPRSFRHSREKFSSFSFITEEDDAPGWQDRIPPSLFVFFSPIRRNLLPGVTGAILFSS